MLSCIISCKKDRNPMPSSATLPPNSYAGLECIAFYNRLPDGTWDTVGHECADLNKLFYYSTHPKPYNAQFAQGTRINDCNQCK